MKNLGCKPDSIRKFKKHPHVIHPNDIISKDRKGLAKFNFWLAVKITNGVGTMWCAYAFFLLDLLMLPPVLQANNIMIWVTYIAQTVLQLVLLPIIMVGQNVIQAQNEAKADTDHKTLTYLSILQDEQMQELKNQTKILLDLQEVLSKK
ncbi:hypothetical protein GH807_02685 [Acetobacterium tundrae]|uniref:DUF1003 domain-containing protein n=1 Tax=Acetobacterium tundrae TaxID=132932 RepID=A0ABR6WI49_9FIRM|nr:hypothetical protein [Acetobacterium tundrae]